MNHNLTIGNIYIFLALVLNTVVMIHKCAPITYVYEPEGDKASPD